MGGQGYISRLQRTAGDREGKREDGGGGGGGRSLTLSCLCSWPLRLGAEVFCRKTC